MSALCVTVLPEYLQCEGVARVLDNLMERAGVTAVATSPYVMEPAGGALAGGGQREPPADAGAGGVRLLDRPLWGKRALVVRTAPSFAPDRALYEGLRYQPAEPDALTAREGHVVADFIAAAKARGLTVYLQMQAAIPPGYRVQFGGPRPDDMPLLPDGGMAEGRVDKNGSLASPHILAYGAALIRDLLRAYPAIDGLRIDWPEYPPYAFDSLFFDFSAHAEAAAARLGTDWARMRAHAGMLRHHLLHDIRDPDLDRIVGDGGAGDGGRYALLRLFERWPGVGDLMALKSHLVDEMLGAYRIALVHAGGKEKAFIPQAFPPPWSAVSGFDFRRAAHYSTAIGVKLYTMHWPMMVGFYADALIGESGGAPPPRGLTRARLVAAIARLLDVADNPASSAASATARVSYAPLDAYPGPEAAHPVSAAAQARKIRAAQAEAGDTPVHAFAHGYGPRDDFEARLRVAWEASGGRVTVNRYGYLCDAKLAAIGRVTGAGA